LFYNIITTIN